MWGLARRLFSPPPPPPLDARLVIDVTADAVPACEPTPARVPVPVPLTTHPVAAHARALRDWLLEPDTVGVWIWHDEMLEIYQEMCAEALWHTARWDGVAAELRRLLGDEKHYGNQRDPISGAWVKKRRWMIATDLLPAERRSPTPPHASVQMRLAA